MLKSSALHVGVKTLHVTQYKTRYDLQLRKVFSAAKKFL